MFVFVMFKYWDEMRSIRSDERLLLHKLIYNRGNTFQCLSQGSIPQQKSHMGETQSGQSTVITDQISLNIIKCC